MVGIKRWKPEKEACAGKRKLAALHFRAQTACQTNDLDNVFLKRIQLVKNK